MTRDPDRLPARILLVDNDADVADVVSAFLAKRGGFEVVQVPDGGQALSTLASERAAGRELALILLDLRMPGMDGMEVLARLEVLGRAPRVVVLSGYVDDDDARRLESSPLVHAIVRKPFDLFALQTVVEEAIALPQAAPEPPDSLPFARALRAPED